MTRREFLKTLLFTVAALFAGDIVFVTVPAYGRAQYEANKQISEVPGVQLSNARRISSDYKSLEQSLRIGGYEQEADKLNSEPAWQESQSIVGRDQAHNRLVFTLVEEEGIANFRPHLSFIGFMVSFVSGAIIMMSEGSRREELKERRTFNTHSS